jgi:Glycosyltransferase family 10 (fucosyltransferase) C-term
MCSYITILAFIMVFIVIPLIDHLLDSIYTAFNGYIIDDQPIPITDFMTNTSGFCGPSIANCMDSTDTHPIVRVHLRGWAASEFNLGAYACPKTMCIISKHTNGHMDYDVLVSSIPPRFRFPSRTYPKTRHAEISMESSINTPSFISLTYLMEEARSWLFSIQHDNNIDLVVRYQPPKQDNSLVQFLPTSYVNAELNAFVGGRQDDDRWVGYDLRDPSMAVVISNCWQRNNNRIDILNDIVKVFSRVHKFGKCFKRDEPSRVVPPTLQKCLLLHRRSAMWDKQKECILQNVMFSYSIENSFEYGYVTEKLWQALTMGAIPIYSLKGVPENRKFLPHPDAALVIEDFASTEHLAMYMRQVSTNRTLWFKHAMAWRYLPSTEISTDFIYAVNNSLATLPCRMCDWWLTDTSNPNHENVFEHGGLRDPHD